MLSGILYTSVCFFEIHMSGRILTRASKDQQVLDEVLPATLVDAIQGLLMTFGSPSHSANILVASLLLTTFKSSLKRLESVTRSPIYALFSSSLDGLTTIRTFSVENDFVNMFLD